jgi:hypothetical protein
MSIQLQTRPLSSPQNSNLIKEKIRTVHSTNLFENGMTVVSQPSKFPHDFFVLEHSKLQPTRPCSVTTLKWSMWGNCDAFAPFSDMLLVFTVLDLGRAGIRMRGNGRLEGACNGRCVTKSETSKPARSDPSHCDGEGGVYKGENTDIWESEPCPEPRD